MKVDFPVVKSKSSKKRLLIISIVAAIALLALGCICYKAIHFNDKPTHKPSTGQTTTPPTKKTKAPKNGFKPVRKMEVQQMGAGAAIEKLLLKVLEKLATKINLKGFGVALSHQQSLKDKIRFLSIALYGASGACGVIAIFQLFKYFELRSKTDE